MSIIKYFDAYCDAGFKVIPLRPFSKIPIYKNWNLNWNKNWVRNYLVNNPNSNIGFLLGEICDVEGDTEEANCLLDSLIGNYPHPKYKSSKSIHHLFLNPDPKLTIFVHSNIEFRGHKHQSVLPPSKHSENYQYNWLVNTKFPIPEMPDNLLDYYKKITFKKPNLKPEHIKPWCSICQQRKYIDKKRFYLENIVFSEKDLLWQCNKCRKIDVRENCRKIRKKLNASSC